MTDIIIRCPAKFLIDTELEPGLYMNLDPLEYFMEGLLLDPAIHNLGFEIAQYETPTETATRLLCLPRALPIELKGIAI